MRSGFVAGDADAMQKIPAVPHVSRYGDECPVQHASIAAWQDEAHVVENRRLYAQKFATATPLIASRLPCSIPDAAFYLWARTPISDTEYAQRLYAHENVTVLPGSYLSRDTSGGNPGRTMSGSHWSHRRQKWPTPPLALRLSIPYLPIPRAFDESSKPLSTKPHEQRATLSATSAPTEVRAAVEQTIAQLDAGTLRVGQKNGMARGLCISGSRKRCCYRSACMTTSRSRAASASSTTRCRTSSPRGTVRRLLARVCGWSRRRLHGAAALWLRTS